MDEMKRREVAYRVSQTLIRAGSSFSDSLSECYRAAIETETYPQSKWVLEMILENAVVAAERRSPLCDDTGIPHLILEVGEKSAVTGALIDAIYEGVEEGLRGLPGRPMAILGDDIRRINQSGGLDPDPAKVLPAPILIRRVPEDRVRLHVLLLGGGPAIRGRSYRVFHHHDAQVVFDQIVEWAIESVKELGCSPCTLSIGIGRSHYEASALMLEAQAYGDHGVQSELEARITERVNTGNVGALGLGGRTSVLATFLRVGPQRASGVRIICMRPGCCIEPRHASVDLSE